VAKTLRSANVAEEKQTSHHPCLPIQHLYSVQSKIEKEPTEKLNKSVLPWLSNYNQQTFRRKANISSSVPSNSTPIFNMIEDGKRDKYKR
jgi:hypothetical protein